MAQQQWIPVLTRWWDPDLSQEETAPYARYLLHRTAELLHSNTPAPDGPPILSTTYLLAYSRPKVWCDKPKDLPYVLHKLEALWQDLKARLTDGVWLEEAWPTETHELRDTLIACLPASNAWTAASKPWAKYTQEDDISKLVHLTPTKRKRFRGAFEPKVNNISENIDNLVAPNHLPQEPTDELDTDIIQHQMNIIADLIYRNDTLSFEEKLTLLDNYLADVIRDLLHYGHSFEYLFRDWLIDEVIKTPKEEDSSTYIERFTDLDKSSLLNGNTHYTVLHRVGQPRGKQLFSLHGNQYDIEAATSTLAQGKVPSILWDKFNEIGVLLTESHTNVHQMGDSEWVIDTDTDKKYNVRHLDNTVYVNDLADIGTHEMPLLARLPLEYQHYETFNTAKHVYEEYAVGSDKQIEQSFFIEQKEEAKDYIAAAINASKQVLQYRSTVLHIAAPEDKIRFDIGRDPLVVDEDSSQIYAALLRRFPSMTSIRSGGRIYDLKDRWLASGKTLEQNTEDTFRYLETLLEWLIQAERFRDTPRMDLTSGSALFVSLWTTFQHIFSKSQNREKLDWREHVPPYIGTQHTFMSIRNFGRTLRYFKRQKSPYDNTLKLRTLHKAEPFEEVLSEILDTCREIHMKKDDSYSSLATDGFLAAKLAKLSRLHPLSTETQGREKHLTLRKELERLETTTISDLILLNEVRNGLVHQIDMDVNDAKLHIILQRLLFYIGGVLNHFIHTYRVLKDHDPEGIHRSVFGNYKQLRKEIHDATLPANPEMLLRPHKLTQKRKREKRQS